MSPPPPPIDLRLKPDELAVVTLCGLREYDKGYANTCLATWDRLKTPHRRYCVNDGTLGDEHRGWFEKYGIELIDHATLEPWVLEQLRDYPTLVEMRKRVPMYRKLVDVPRLFANHDRVLFVDTDILYTGPLRVPEPTPDVAYGMDDSIGYSGSWRLAYRDPMIVGLNSGFMLYPPRVVDLDMLERYARKYVFRAATPWLTEQTTWGAVAADQPKPRRFTGEQYRVLGGFRKRKRDDILNNRFVWVGDKSQIDNEQEMLDLARGGRVLHIAGMGKRWYEAIATLCDDALPEVTLDLIDAPLMTAGDRAKLASRLFTGGVVQKARAAIKGR
ncbi:MAG: hypothetical protein AAGE65_01380 [Planctomycetota bacterium]